MGDLNLNIIIYPFVALVSIIGILLNKEKIFFKFLAIILTILAMIRFDTGYDYYWYYAVSKVEFINDPQIEKLYIQLEPGIKKIVDLARYLGHPQYFFAITGLITFGLIFYTIYKDSKSPLISLAFFMFLQMGFISANGMIMQACAISLCYYSVKLIFEKKKIKGLSLIILATFLFHQSAIICMILLFVPTKKIKLRYVLAYILILFFIIEEVLPKLIYVYFPQYYYLLNFENTKLYGKRDILICVLIYIFTMLITIFKLSKNNESNYFLENIFRLGTIFSFITLIKYGGFFPFRVGIYFFIFILTLIGEYIENLNFKLKLKIIIKIIIIIVMNLWVIKQMIKSNSIVLNKKIVFTDLEVNVRPNSNGFRLFFGKNENNMDRYLPNSEEHKYK